MLLCESLRTFHWITFITIIFFLFLNSDKITTTGLKILRSMTAMFVVYEIFQVPRGVCMSLKQFQVESSLLL